MPSPVPGSPEYIRESRVSQILAGSIAPAVIASIFVLARLYSRLIIIKSFGADDYWIGISWVASLALTVLNCVFVHYGSGHHSMLQTKADGILTIKLAFVTRIFYNFVLGTTKIGICAFYLRIFSDQWSRYLSFALSGFIGLYTLFFVIFTIAFCFPDPKKPFGKCTKNTPDLFVSAACNILADLLLLAFIAPRIWGLRIKKMLKVALLGVLGLSILVIVAAFIRMFKVKAFNESKDRSWDFVNITTWSAVEVQTGLFCASAPAIKPLLRKLFPGHFSTVGPSSNKATPNPYSNNKRAHTLSGKFSRRNNGRDIELSSCEDGIGGVGDRNKTGIWSDTYVEMNDGDSSKAIIRSDNMDSGKGR
ncbi:hypothetical protein DL98DRAFT_474508 [Cadophora sp. DSE1049]|nr:hypothetical protein DL98DRAFT_474508 [Cadophora sp. DSE1049]